MPPKQKSLSHEEKIKFQQQQVEKEFQRKKTIIRYKKFLLIIPVIFLIIILALLAIYIFNKITKEPPIEEKVEKAIEVPPSNFEIKVLSTEILQSSPLYYDALAKISNADLNWGVSRLVYTILLKDENEVTVGQREGITFILPNQVKSIIELNIAAEKVATTVSIELRVEDVQKLKNPPELIFKTENIAYQDLDNKSKVSASLTNQTSFGFDEVIINVLVYDSNGQLQGLNFTTINDVSANTKRDFSVLWRSRLSVKKPKIIIEPYVNPYNAQPFLDVYSEGQALEY